MRRGEIWWANLPEPNGSGPGLRRPVLIMQSDLFNKSRINSVVVVVITKNTKLAEAPGNVVLKSSSSHLPIDSVINVSQIITVDKGLLTDYVSALTDRKLKQVESGMRLVLSL